MSCCFLSIITLLNIFIIRPSRKPDPDVVVFESSLQTETENSELNYSVFSRKYCHKPPFTASSILLVQTILKVRELSKDAYTDI